MTIRARIVLPVSGPLIEDGAVRVEGNRIVEVGKWKALSRRASRRVIDLGENILLPGLINAHCHLEYTWMAGRIAPQENFPDWIRAILDLKGAVTETEVRQSWLDGAAALLRSGVTSVANSETHPGLLRSVWNETPLRVSSFIEMTGVKSRRPPEEIVQEALDQIAQLSQAKCRAGLSPHAPYSTTPELLRLAAKAAIERNVPLTVHAAESIEEFQMFMERSGSLFEWLQNDRDVADCGGVSPIGHLARHGVLQRDLIAVHANYLAPGDAALLARNGVSVAHCPRSHEYFRHAAFPYEELIRSGVNVCLGTDSPASSSSTGGETSGLNFFSEMRAFAKNRPQCRPEEILKLSTVGGARALGRPRELGVLDKQALADLIAIPYSGPIQQSYDSVVHESTCVTASMIDGDWAIAPGAD